MFSAGSPEILLPPVPGVLGEYLLGQFRHMAALRELGELAELGNKLEDLSHSAFALARESPGWISPSQVAVARRLTESAGTLLAFSQLILRHRDAVQRSVDT